MAPHSQTTTISKIEVTLENRHNEPIKATEPHEYYKSYFGEFQTELKWSNIILILGLHLYTVHYFFWIFPFYENKYKLFVVYFVLGSFGGFGVTGGAHRFWTHRAFKAKLPLQIILAICYTISGQNTILDWVRDHRVHHKFSETDADPHNSNRGFFFAHVGWLMMRKHPEVYRRGKTIDCSDITQDPLIKFHTKHFAILKTIFCFILPTVIPMLLWNETFYHSFMSNMVRYVINLNCTWAVNSAAHIWGFKPYDKSINPVENWFVSLMAMGEGWHNYHHTFPWDYKAAELGKFLNVTTLWLNIFAKIGWAYDLKSPSKELVEKIIVHAGDGSHHIWGHKEIPHPDDKNNKVL